MRCSTRRSTLTRFACVLAALCVGGFAPSVAHASPRDLTPTTLQMPDTLGPIGARILITGILRRADTGAFLANKTVEFFFGNVSMGSAVSDKTGRARIAFLVGEQMGIARWPVSCQFNGDSSFGGSAASALLLTVRAQTQIALKGQTAAIGKPVAIKPVLSRLTDNALLPGRTIVFSIKGIKIGSAITDATGTASFTYAFDQPLTLGTYTLTASFLGDVLENPTDASADFNITQSATKITVTGGTAKAGATIALKGKLVRSSDASPLSGRVLKFSVAGTPIGTATTNLGIATLNYAVPAGTAAGAYQVKVEFAGETLYGASSGTGTLTVK